MIVAGFTKAKVWKVPQHPLEEAEDEIKNRTLAGLQVHSKASQELKTLPGLMVKACHSKAEIGRKVPG